ncbi:MAG: hypothetical protein Q8K66_07540 [Sediminibacterium sp.]|nr:hypothetical protein [Sediminibacterium sp.]MDP3127979.1 hypothetical protein [Sediminibacterium sp.]
MTLIDAYRNMGSNRIEKTVNSIKRELLIRKHTSLKRHCNPLHRSDDDLSEIAANINSGVRFIAIKKPNDSDWDITRNPTYLKEFRRDLRSAVIGGIFSLIVGWLLILLSNQPERQEIKQLNNRVDTLSNRIDSLHKK